MCADIFTKSSFNAHEWDGVVTNIAHVVMPKMWGDGTLSEKVATPSIMHETTNESEESLLCDSPSQAML